jgi:hypothetical protein
MYPWFFVHSPFLAQATQLACRSIQAFDGGAGGCGNSSGNLGVVGVDAAPDVVLVAA